MENEKVKKESGDRKSSRVKIESLVEKQKNKGLKFLFPDFHTYF